jgi:hypothetical protein
LSVFAAEVERTPWPCPESELVEPTEPIATMGTEPTPTSPAVATEDENEQLLLVDTRRSAPTSDGVRGRVNAASGDERGVTCM